jgi:2-iminobutanoate/2-iminopropanoate deaminase
MSRRVVLLRPKRPLPATAGKGAHVITQIEAVSTTQAPKVFGPYSQGIRAGGFIFCAGQAGLNPATGQIVTGGVKEQTRQVIRNLQAVLRAGGSDLDRVVKVSVFLADWKDFKDINEAFTEFFDSAHPPARSTIQGERWPEGSLVAIEAIALAP